MQNSTPSFFLAVSPDLSETMSKFCHHLTPGRYCIYIHRMFNLLNFIHGNVYSKCYCNSVHCIRIMKHAITQYTHVMIPLKHDIGKLDWPPIYHNFHCQFICFNCSLRLMKPTISFPSHSLMKPTISFPSQVFD